MIVQYSKNQSMRQPPALTMLDNPLVGIPEADRIAVVRKIGADAVTKYQGLVGELDNQLRAIEPQHAMGCAGYFLVFTGDKPAGTTEFSFGQHQAELLQALVLRHPGDFFEQVIGTPDQVQKALDLVKDLSEVRLKIPYADLPEDKEEFGRRSVIEAMRLHTQLIRGDFYAEQLPRLFRPVLQRVDQQFFGLHGIAPGTLFDLLMRLTLRIEVRMNDHFKRVVTFFRATTIPDLVKLYKKSFPSVVANVDEVRAHFGRTKEGLQQAKMAMLAHSDLRIPDIFRIQRSDVADECKLLGQSDIVDQVIKKLDRLSVGFGELGDVPVDHIFMNNPIWTRPLIRIGKEEWLLPLPTSLVSYCPDIFRTLADDDARLKASFADARAAVLEDSVTAAFRAALPRANIWQSVTWRDPASGKDYECDTVVRFDRWLLLVEEKSGQITDSARRGSYDRLKREVQKLMIDPAEQSERFAKFLSENPGEHHFAAGGGTACKIDSRDIDGIIRVNVTNENVGNLNARAGNLVEAGLVPTGTDLPPTMSIGWLDVVLRLLGSPSAIVHYLYRRKSFEDSAVYMADELDLVAFYLDTGFNIGDTETDGTPLMIYGYSGDLDIALTRSREQPLGREQSAVTPFWQGILDHLEAEARPGWLTLALRLRDVAKDDQLKLERMVRRAVYKAKKKGPALISLSYGPKSRRAGLLVLVRGGTYDANQLESDLLTEYRALNAENVTNPLFLLFVPPKATAAREIRIVEGEEMLTAASQTT